MTFADIVSSSGLVLGLVLGVIILLAHREDRPTWLLGLFVFSLTLRIVPFLLIRLPFGQEYPGVVWVPLYFYYASAPLLYLYTRRLTGLLEWRQDYVHLVPALIEVVLFSIVFLGGLAVEGPLIDMEMASNIIGTHSIIAIAYLVFYGALLIRLLELHQDRILTYYSNLTDRRLRWIRLTVFFMVAFAMAYTVLRYGPLPTTPSILTLFGATVNFALLCFVTYHGVRQLRLQPLHHLTEEEEAVEDGTDHSLLYNRVVNHLKTSRVFLQHDLTLSELASRVGMSERTLSRVVNAESGTHFNGLINHFRILAAKEILCDERYNHYTMEAVADEVGFNSKATFYQAFRRETDQSPAAYRRVEQNKEAA